MSETAAGSYEAPADLPVLSEREIEILTLVAAGQSVEYMASSLYLSPHTVRTHVRNIRRKLGVRTCAHAVGLACAHRLIDPLL